MDLASLTHADFEGREGEAFELAGAAEAVALRLESVSVGAETPEGLRRPFSLTFRGPADPALAQQTVALEHAALGRLEIFVVPLARDAEGTRYEAVFG